MYSVLDRTGEAPPVSLAREGNRVEGTYDLITAENTYYNTGESANREVQPSNVYESSPVPAYSKLERSRVGQVVPQQAATPQDEVSPLPYISFVSPTRTTQEDIPKERKYGRLSVCLVACSVVLIIVTVAMLLGVVAALVMIASLRSEIASVDSSRATSPPMLNTQDSESTNVIFNTSLWSDLAEIDDGFRLFMDDIKEKLDVLESNASMSITSLSNLVGNLSQSLVIVLENNVSKRISQLEVGLCSHLDNISKTIDFQLKGIKERVAMAAMLNQRRVDGLTAKLINGIQNLYVFNSCDAIMTLSLPFHSGMYRIRSSSESAIFKNCTIYSCNGVFGGWRRVAYLNTNKSDPIQCPSGLEERDDPPSCIRNVSEAGCSSVGYLNHDIPYRCIYGRVNARQSGSLDGFEKFMDRPDMPTLEDNYVDGVSLTHGSNSRNHIWTFVAGRSTPPNCNACDNRRPSFIGSDFSCEVNVFCRFGDICFDQLWNGGPQQCVGGATFYRQLSQPTTEDIEMRVCRDEMRNNEDILITLVDIYVL